MGSFSVSLFKNVYPSFLAALWATATLYYLNDICLFFKIQKIQAFIFAFSVITLVISSIQCFVSFFQTVWEKLYPLLSKSTSILYNSDEIILTSSRIKSFIFLLISLVFVAGSIEMIHSPSKASHVWTGWLGVLFCGIGAILFTLNLIPGASYLKISPNGLQICNLWKKTTYDWSDIKEFYVEKNTSNYRGISHKWKLVSFETSSSVNNKNRNNWAKLFTHNVGSLPDNYSIQHEDLAELLNEKKKKYTISG